MKYIKPPLTFEQQADLLIKRGLVADKNLLIERLSVVNYYRFSGYLYPFRNDDDTFKPGTTFESVWRRYTFDRRLRILCMDAIERVEVAIRTQLIYLFAHTYGAFAYTEASNLPKLNKNQHLNWTGKLKNEIDRSKEIFLKHFFEKYGAEHDMPPIWMVSGIMSFGVMLTMFDGIEPEIKRKIASEYMLTDTILRSWLKSINAVRNNCAHHSRLWNSTLGYRPIIPHNIKKHPDWHYPVKINNDKIFAVLTVLKYLLNYIAPQSKWSNRLLSLLSEYSDIPIKYMDFPDNWQVCPIWNSTDMESK